MQIDKLPPVLVGPRVAVRDPRADPEGESEAERKKRAAVAAAAAAKKKPGADSKKKAGPPAVDFIQLPPNMTPSLADAIKVWSFGLGSTLSDSRAKNHRARALRR